MAPIRTRVGTKQILAVPKGCGWADEQDRYATGDVAGSGISFGDPVCATGLQILATLTREFHRSGARFGSETMCLGGGPGISVVELA